MGLTNRFDSGLALLCAAAGLALPGAAWAGAAEIQDQAVTQAPAAPGSPGSPGSDDVRCRDVDVLMAPAPATLVASCGGYSGKVYFANDQRVKSVTFSLGPPDGDARLVTLKEPKLGIRSYYSALENPDVRPELTNAGFRVRGGEVATLESFVVRAGTPVYADPGTRGGGIETAALAAKRDGRSPASADEGAGCFFKKTPVLLEVSGVAGSRMCVGEVKCEAATNLAACRPVGDGGRGCPTAADQCIGDTSVSFSQPERSVSPRTDRAPASASGTAFDAAGATPGAPGSRGGDLMGGPGSSDVGDAPKGGAGVAQ